MQANTNTIKWAEYEVDWLNNSLLQNNRWPLANFRPILGQSNLTLVSHIFCTFISIGANKYGTNVNSDVQ